MIGGFPHIFEHENIRAYTTFGIHEKSIENKSSLLNFSKAYCHSSNMDKVSQLSLLDFYIYGSHF